MINRTDGDDAGIIQRGDAMKGLARQHILQSQFTVRILSTGIHSRAHHACTAAQATGGMDGRGRGRGSGSDGAVAGIVVARAVQTQT